MLGLASGLSGWLMTLGLGGAAVVFLAGLAALVVVAYSSASRSDIDGTTEVAAFVVMAAGTLAGVGYIRLASGIVAITTLLLIEKTRLHRLVRALDRAELRAGARFAVMAAVILPMLPAGPFGPGNAIRPRLLWALVLFFSGLSFVGYVTQRTIGRSRGYMLTGTLGGLLSSTSVTLTFSRLSRSPGQAEAGRALASGTLGANTMLFPRVLAATALLAPALAWRLWPMFVVPFVIALTLALRSWNSGEASDRKMSSENPLQVGSALQMAALFQLVLFGVAFATRWFGERGLYASASVLGLADIDALTVSMADLTTTGTAASVTAMAICIGIIANTCVKLGIALVVGRGHYRVLTVAGLAAIGVSLAGALWATAHGLTTFDGLRAYFFAG
jgi:uncharacterized membrane protein (DUF4010 family)